MTILAHPCQAVLLSPRIIADLRPGDECTDPDYPGLRVRREAATGLAKLGCPRVVQDRILNHVDGSVSAIYDRHRYDAEARVTDKPLAGLLAVLTHRIEATPGR